ncbi:MAG: tetratricopeptide repeat protein, partial [Limisphaerales bacterium]
VRGHFEKARDLDALPLRTDGRINGILRELASAESGAKLVDLDRDIGTPLAGQTPGDETFYDHVHFTFMGNYRAARLIATEIEKNLLAEVSAKRSVNWASAPLCDRALGLTDWNRRSAFENMMRRQMEPPFTDQSNYTNRIEGLARAVANLREGLTGRAATDAFAIYQEALTRNESDFRLRESFAEFLEAAGRFPEAAEQRKAIAAWVPHDSVAAYHAGRVLAGIKQGVEARAHLQRALQLRPNFPEAHLEIGRSYALEGMHEEALRAYDQALQQRPEYVSALMQKAHSYAAIARRKEAKSMLREAIRISPENWEARYMLAIELAADNEMAEAIVQFNEVTRLRPTYAQAYFNLSVALAKAGRLREAYLGFQKTLELDPEHKSASEYLSAMAREFSR